MILYELSEIKVDIPFKCEYPIKTFARIKWPAKITHNEKEHIPTGKLGNRLFDNTPAAEYTTPGSRYGRIWLNADGTITED